MYIHISNLLRNPYIIQSDALQLAEEFGLKHESRGEGDDRQITVVKVTPTEVRSPTDVTVKPPTNQELESDVGIDIVEEGSDSCESETGEYSLEKESLPQKDLAVKVCKGFDVKAKSDVKQKDNTPLDCITCSKCKKDVPKNNYELHEIRCHIDNTDDRVTSMKTTESKPKLPKNKKKKAKPKVHIEEDFDAVLAEANLMNTVCNYPKCKSFTTVLGQNCPYCMKRFCLSHHIPEGHGCGMAAKANARAVIKGGVLYQGSGVPEKRTDPNKKAHLQRKLDKKLNELSDSRKLKKKDK